MISWIYDSKRNKWKLWYIIAISIILSFAIWWLIMWIYAMTIVVFLLAWVYFLIENNSEKITKIIVDNEWINVSSTFYAYAQIEYFAIVYSSRNPILLRIKLKWKNSSFTDIYLVEWINIWDLRLFLEQYINEKANVEMNLVEIMLYLLKI